MKKLIAVILTLVMAVSIAGCSLFNDDSVVKFEEIYTHKDPDGLKYDERKVMIKKDFNESMAELFNMIAYPDTAKYDVDGNMIGMYDYDPETGLTSGYMDFTTGEFVAEVVDLGKPDESLMVNFAGTVTLGCVIYGKEDKAISSYLYAFMTDKADTDVVKSSMEIYYGWTMEKESDTVLVCKQDEVSINEKFNAWEVDYGQTQSDRSVSGYAANLQIELGLKNYGVNPYKAYAEIKDPENLEFDEKVILTSNGAYSFADASLENDMLVRTDVVYGLKGKVVAHCTYYEYKTKAAADKLDAVKNNNFNGEASRVSDTALLDTVSGSTLQEIISAYIGYNVLKDDSVEAYAENIEGTYFAMRYDQ